MPLPKKRSRIPLSTKPDFWKRPCKSKHLQYLGNADPGPNLSHEEKWIQIRITARMIKREVKILSVNPIEGSEDSFFGSREV